MKTPRKQLNLSVFILALMKSAKSQRNVMGQKGKSGECKTEGNLARRPVCSDSFQCPPFSLERGKSLLTGGSFDLLPGRRADQRVLPTPAISPIPSA